MVDSDKSNQANAPFSFVDTEHQVLAFWKSQRIFQKSLTQTKNNTPYVFYDGPPFATGKPHHGHLLASTIKDIIPRYFTMKGRYVQRRFGWDCHGLPIEHETDKILGMPAQEAVEKMGIKAYNDECRKIVQRYTSEWEKTVLRLGRWVDFENDYRTMEPWFMESVWWAIKELWNKDLIYQGLKVVPFSTALGTILSNFEAGSNYQEIQDPAVTLLFKLDDEDCYLAAWTTTPWTLPSNLGLCVGADIDYLRVKDTDRDITFILAKARLAAVGKNKNLTVIAELKGAELIGKTYQPLFPFFSELKAQGAFQVLADDYVSTDSGTGIVHTAPAFGEDDFRIFKAAGIDALVCPIDMKGCFTHEVPDFEGLLVKDADKPIIRALKASGHLYQHDVEVHSYPFCPRSDTPIIYRAIPSWYVKVESMRDELVARNQSINWVPENIKKGRMGNWLAGAIDWAISRNRYWGTPIPIWINDKTDRRVCMGSIDELAQYTGVTVKDLHRDYVDDLTFTIDGEAGTYRRVSEVLDCWFESGAMPYAQVHYPFENQADFTDRFPAEFIAEGLDQTRGWFYTLSILSNALFGSPAFKNVIVNGIVMAEDGKKMSKRLRNYTAPDELMEVHGADALRLYLINSGLVRAEAQNFSDAGVQDMVRRALLPWYNAFKFLKTYAKLDDWQPATTPAISDNILDRWILSKLQSLQLNVAKEMENYHLYNVVPVLFEFIEQLTNLYIRLNRSRFWDETLTADKQQAYQTLYTCIYELSVSMAPFAPFLSEHLYQELQQSWPDNDTPESVHLCQYPMANEALISVELEKAVGLLKEIILLGRHKRNQEKIKTRIPLSAMTIIHKDPLLLNELAKLENYIKSELNVKQVTYSEDETHYINLYAKPNSPVLGKKLGKTFKQYKSLIEELSSTQIDELTANGSIELGEHTFSTEDILIFREAKPGTQTISNRYISIDMNLELTDDLLAEGLAREVINRIQKSRKDLNFNVDDRIAVIYSGSESIEATIAQHHAYIAAETLAVKLAKGEVSSNNVLTFDIEGGKLSVNIKQV